MSDKPLYEFTSHIEGKNAKVQIWPDRIEWERKGVDGGKVKAGILTLGVSTLFTGIKGKETDMIPIKLISGVTSKKGMGGNTVVAVRTAAGGVDFRVSHKEADQARKVLAELMLTASQPAVVVAAAAPAAAAAVDHGAQLQQLAALRDSGVLDEQEFAAKKAEILSRM